MARVANVEVIYPNTRVKRKQTSEIKTTNLVVGEILSGIREGFETLMIITYLVASAVFSVGVSVVPVSILYILDTLENSNWHTNATVKMIFGAAAFIFAFLVHMGANLKNVRNINEVKGSLSFLGVLGVVVSVVAFFASTVIGASFATAGGIVVISVIWLVADIFTDFAK